MCRALIAHLGPPAPPPPPPPPPNPSSVEKHTAHLIEYNNSGIGHKRSRGEHAAKLRGRQPACRLRQEIHHPKLQIQDKRAGGGARAQHDNRGQAPVHRSQQTEVTPEAEDHKRVTAPLCRVTSKHASVTAVVCSEPRSPRSPASTSICSCTVKSCTGE